jgi:subtilisin family serine protease
MLLCWQEGKGCIVDRGRRNTVRPETDYTYTDKSSGRQLSFTPKPDEMMVTFQETPSEAALNDVVQVTPLLSVSQGYDLDHGFAAVYVSPHPGAEAAVHSVVHRPEIANSLPAMIDQEGLTRYFLPDEFTVQFLEGVSKEQAEHIIDQQGSRILVEQRTPGYYTLVVPEKGGLFETIREFSSLEEVAFAEPSEVVFNWLQQYIPDDPDFPQLWGLNNTGQTVNGVAGTADADIDAPEAWDLTRGNRGVHIAVIDTGADLDHPDLEANILPRGAEDWNFSDSTSSIPQDISRTSHGTHVSGIIAAVDNAQGVIGVAPGCWVMPLRMAVGWFSGILTQYAVDAIKYVSQQATANPWRHYIINGSWGGGGDHAGLREAIQEAASKNIVMVFGAGNNNRNTDVESFYPGIYPEVIAVAAVDQNDQKADFSNFGTNVDVSAPGVNIWSTKVGPPGAGSYGFGSGTSMAVPHVCGVAALVWSHNRNLSNQQVRRVIENTCDDIDAANPGFVGMLGRGRVNAARAVSLAPSQGPIAYSLMHRVADDTLSSGGPPYDVSVVTSWVLGDWEIGRACHSGTVQQILELQVGNGPFQVTWQGTEPTGDLDLVTRTLRTDTTYRFRHTATCQSPSGNTPSGNTVTGVTYGVRFSLRVIEDNSPAINYVGTWVPRTSASATGGTTHEARQVGATASHTYDGIAAAWVTTVDEKPYPIQARVMCDGVPCGTVNTGEHEFGEERAVKWSSTWSSESSNRRHTVEVISDESRLVDVDAFIAVHRV